MLILGLDLETTGLDFDRDRVTEIGAILWDTATAQPLQILSVLVDDRTAPPLRPEIQQLNGLSEDILARFGENPEVAFAKLTSLARFADAIVAHNGAAFDRPMLDASFRRLGFPLLSPVWIDTTMDVPFPPHITTRKLIHLAAEHGFLNPFSHRAIFDVLTMLRVLQPYVEKPDGAEAVLARARVPVVTVRALVSGDVAAGFGYRRHEKSGEFRRLIKSDRVEEERTKRPFPIELVEP